MKEIYSFLLAKGKLLDSHKEELITKRGFPEKAIIDQRFFSGGNYLAEFEEEMAGAFKDQDLLASGVFIYDNNKSRMNPMLFKETNLINKKEVSNIIIPYLDKDGAPYCLRPHKLGFKGVPSEIFQARNLLGDPAEVILTEGEFKAVAGTVYGIPTIGIPGIASFSELHYQKIVDFFRPCVKSVKIMFDNEVKDDPAFPGRFKEKPGDRYDTQFYAYYMATKLEGSGFEVKIATMPDAWRVDGKIDIDGALKGGKLRGDILRVMYEALPRNEYLSELPAEAKQVVLRKRAQKMVRSHIKKEFNRYVAQRQRGKSTWEEPISDFVMKIVATHDTAEGIKRVVEFVNEFGKRSGSFSIDAEAMASADKFRTFCMKKGDFTWKGSLDDLMTIWQSEFLTMDEGRYIVETDQIGWVGEEKLWVFGNVGIKPDGTLVHPDGNGVFWMEKRGVKPSSLIISGGKNAMASGIPHLYKGDGPTPEEIRDRLADTIGREEACVVMGWSVAVAFMEELHAYYSSFPFLFVTGRWQSGKSTIASWVMKLFGVEQEGLALSQTTPVAIQRLLSYYSSLPVFLDEFRNTKDVTMKNGFLRNAYNRQWAGKGIKSDFGLREAKVRGTLIIAGEETPKDGALLTRCIHIFVSRQKRKDDHYKWFVANRLKMSSFFFNILQKKTAMSPAFVETFSEWKEAFSKDGRDDRVSINYATVVAGYAALYGDSDLNFASWLMKETRDMQVEFREEQAVAVFVEDLMALKTQKKINSDYWAIEDGKIFLYFHGIHQIWSEQYRKTRGEEAFKEGSIRAYLKEEPGYLEMNVAHRINGQMKKCIVFDFEEAPIDLKNLVDLAFDGANRDDRKDID